MVGSNPRMSQSITSLLSNLPNKWLLLLKQQVASHHNASYIGSEAFALKSSSSFNQDPMMAIIKEIMLIRIAASVDRTNTKKGTTLPRPIHFPTQGQ